MISLASCSSDELMPEGQPGEVTFTVQLPADMATRSFGDGTTATTLNYAIYEQDAVAGTAGCALVEGTATFTNFKATVTERLLPGKTYKAAFWAASAAAPYTFNADAMTMTVNTADLKTNDENGDGFFGSLENISTSDGAYTGDVTLTRPFAQVNVGTNDYEQAQKLGLVLTDVQTSLSIPDMPTGLNLFDGTTVTGSEQTANFTTTAIPADGETFPVAGTPAYKYLAMAYVLMPKAEDKSITTVTFNSNKEAITPAAVAWTNVPVQRNFRTNIYGSLLTNPAQIDVEINPEWDGAYNREEGVMVWDGTSEAPVVDDAAKTVTLSTPEQLAGFAEAVKNGNTYAGYTVTLESSVDLGGQIWTPIGAPGKRFGGTFDGQGNTIFNMTVQETQAYGTGIFYDLIGGAVVKNVNLEGAKVTTSPTSDYIGNVRGFIAGYAYGNVTFENVHVRNSEMFGFGKVGGILGMAADPGTTQTVLTNCSVENVTIIADQHAGGLIGLAQNQVVLTNCDVKNVTFKRATTTYPGYITLPDSTLATKTVKDITLQTPMSGVYQGPYSGEWYYAAYAKYFTYYPLQGDDWKRVGQENFWFSGMNCNNYPTDYHWNITTPYTPAP